MYKKNIDRAKEKSHQGSDVKTKKKSHTDTKRGLINKQKKEKDHL